MRNKIGCNLKVKVKYNRQHVSTHGGETEKKSYCNSLVQTAACYRTPVAHMPTVYASAKMTLVYELLAKINITPLRPISAPEHSSLLNGQREHSHERMGWWPMA